MKTIVFCVAESHLMPEKKTPGALCRDLCIATSCTIAPQSIILIGTGLKVALPPTWHIKLYARSGLPSKQGLMLANSVALMDSDYRGEYILQLYNVTAQPVIVEQGSRVAQMELAPSYIPGEPITTTVPDIEYLVDAQIYDTFAEHYPTERGEGRFHSTGI